MHDRATASPPTSPSSSTWTAAIRLGLVVSAVAAAIAVALTAFGDVSQTALVIAVIVVGFVVSWIHSGRTAMPADEPTPAGPERRRSGAGHVRVR